MATKEFIFEQIEKEFTAARTAKEGGNDGKARVCARRAVGHTMSWFVSKYPRSGQRSDAMSQLQGIQNDPMFSQDVHDAAVRLTTKISGQFSYSSLNDPIEDAKTIINAITILMESNAI